MLVDALVLRRDGVKRSRAELECVPPQRLTLTVLREVDTQGPSRGVRVTAYLSQGERAPPFLREVALHGAVLTRVHRDSFVLVGIEEIGRRPNHSFVPQAWWCRVVRDEGIAPRAMAFPGDAGGEMVEG